MYCNSKIQLYNLKENIANMRCNEKLTSCKIILAAYRPSIN